MKSVQLVYGSGGQVMQQLIGDLFMQVFVNFWLVEQEDQVCFDLVVFVVQGDCFVFFIDSYVIDLLFFFGGNIGKLVVCGIVNDVVVSGVILCYFFCGFIFEEGLEMVILEVVVVSMVDIVWVVGIVIVIGDIKVVLCGVVDKLFINIVGIGVILVDVYWGMQQISVGDVLLVSGMLGDYGVIIFNLCEQMGLDGVLFSDCVVLMLFIQILCLLSGVKVLCDVICGGVNVVVYEFVVVSGCGIELQEVMLLVNDMVCGVCELFGLDVLNFVNEGKLVFVVVCDEVENVLVYLWFYVLGCDVVIIGEVVVCLGVCFVGLYGVKWMFDFFYVELLLRIC